MLQQDIQATRAQRADGEAGLVAKKVGDRTRLADLYQRANAKIRIPNSFADRLEAVLINTSGGATGGDRLSWSIEAGADCDVTVTTQACEKIYKSDPGEEPARVMTRLVARQDAKLAWIPQETILFDEARIERHLEADIATGASLTVLEAVIMGRTAMGETVINALFRDRWRIRREGKLFHAEETRIDGEISSLVSQNAVLGARTVFATLLHCPSDPDTDHLEASAREARNAATSAPAPIGLSVLPGRIIVRIAATDMGAMRATLLPVLIALTGRSHWPKVWDI